MNPPTEQQQINAVHQAMRVALLREFDRLRRLARVVEPHARLRAQIINLPTRLAR